MFQTKVLFKLDNEKGKARLKRKNEAKNKDFFYESEVQTARALLSYYSQDEKFKTVTSR